MAFVLEREEFFDRADTYNGQHFIFELEFNMPAFLVPVSAVDLAIRTSLFAADPVVQSDYLSYTLERDTEGIFFDRFRFRLLMVGQLNQESSGTKLEDIASAPGRYTPGATPSVVIAPIIIAIGAIAFRIALALGVFAILLAITWRILKGGLFCLLGNCNPSGTDILMLTAIITLGVGVILLKGKGTTQRSLQRG